MPLPILNQPLGLPGLLASKNQGQGLRELADLVTPTIDLQKMLLLNNRENLISVVNSAGALGINAWAAGGLQAVGAGELLYVWEYCVTCNCGAGEAATFAPAVTPENALGTFGEGRYLTLAANQRGRVSIRDFWALPGFTFQFDCLVAPTLTPDFQGLALVTRMRF